MRSKIAKHQTLRGSGMQKLELLSKAERRVFDAMLCSGDTATIAKRVRISPATARNHMIAIYRKFEIHSRVDIMALFVVPPSA